MQTAQKGQSIGVKMLKQQMSVMLSSIALKISGQSMNAI
jgi:hypothetical protein